MGLFRWRIILDHFIWTIHFPFWLILLRLPDLCCPKMFARGTSLDNSHEVFLVLVSLFCVPQAGSRARSGFRVFVLSGRGRVLHGSRPALHNGP